jgi:hypothetical protein
MAGLNGAAKKSETRHVEIKLKKSLTDEALAAMSRNTMVDGGAVDKDVMAQFEKVLKERLDKIPNATLKKAIDESVRETATDKLMKATPAQVTKIVDDAFDDITKQLGIKPAPPPPPPQPTYTPPPRSYGGK